MNKYGFCWSYNEDPDAVPIPELDAFLDDLKDVFLKHGVALEEAYDEQNYVRLIPVDGDWDFDFILNHLENFDGDIPWLLAAYQTYRANKNARAAREHEAWKNREAIRERELYETLKAKYEGPDRASMEDQT